MKRLKFAALLWIAALLAGCGGGGSASGPEAPPSPPPPPPPPPAYFVEPQEGQALQGTVSPISWERVPQAEAYRLQIGRQAGTSDLLTTAELPATQTQFFLPGDTDRSTPLYARLSVRVNGEWRSGRDVSFQVASVSGAWQSPQPGQRLRQSEISFRWQTKADAKRYYLWLGEQPGGKELVDSGELPASAASTSLPPQMLPRERNLVARLWRQLADGRWVFDEDIYFQVQADPGEMIHPSWEDRIPEAELSRAFSWAPIPDAESYFLYVGTEPGLQDVASSGGLPATQTTFAPVLKNQAHRPLYARLYHLKSGKWIAGQDLPFQFSPSAATIKSPTLNSRLSGSDFSVLWDGVEAASNYKVIVGRQLGGNDVYDSGTLDKSSRSHLVTAGATDKLLHVRLLSLINGSWRHFVGSVVYVNQESPRIELLTESDDTGRINPAAPISWSPVAGASAYRISIGTTPGTGDIHSSEAIISTRKLVQNLPINTLIHIRIGALVSGNWHEEDFTKETNASTDASIQIERLIRDLTVETRAMANHTGENIPGTILDRYSIYPWSTCFNFSNTLISLLKSSGLPYDTRLRDTCLIRNGTECHTLVELRESSNVGWRAYDPTFAVALATTNNGNQHAASVDVIAELAAIIDTEKFTPQLLSENSQVYLNDYYLDYLSLFAKPVAVDGAAPSEGSVLGFFEQVEAPVEPGNYYLLRCPDGTTNVTVEVDDQDKVLVCSDVDRLTPVFLANSIESVSGDPLPEIYTPRRLATWPKQ